MAASKFVDGASREAFWRKHVESWRSSGETITGYCRTYELSVANFYYWRNVLRERAARPGHLARSAGPGFVEVEMALRREASIEIALGEARRIQVHPGFDEETLARVVAVLEGV